MGFAEPGITKLSELEIDVAKSWLTYPIKLLGTPTEDYDGATKKYVDDNVGGVWDLTPTIYDVGYDRFVDTIYQNTGTKTRIVVVSIIANAESSTIGVAVHAHADLLVGATSPPNDYYSEGGITLLQFLGELPLPDEKLSISDMLIAFVPAGYYYKVTKDYTAGGSVDVYYWVEFDL